MNFSEAMGESKKKKASGSEKRRRPGMLSIRVSDSERAEIEAAADRSGLTVGSYVRAQVLAAPKTRAIKKPRIESALLSKLLGQLGRVGGNIHQIVKHMNYKEGVIRDELEAALSDFRESAAAIMKAMGRLPP